MKLSYFDLLSPEPMNLSGIGGVISPKLRDIASIGISNYQYYLNFLSTDLKPHFYPADMQMPEEFLSGRDNSLPDAFDLFISNKSNSELMCNIFNFFIKEDVVFSPQNKCFLAYSDNKVTGRIDKETYPKLCRLILKRCGINQEHEELDMSKAKNQKTLEIMQKLQKGREESSKHPSSDKNMDLGNLISAIANKSSSLNILNIWDLTIFQLFDCFSRLSYNTIYEIGATNAAVWGTKDSSFDTLSWYKNLSQ